MIDIDLVYLWVNGNDPKWVAKRNAHIGKPTGKQENCKGRYADSGELKYSLRSVEKYAPWIRKIFIVTDDQVPEWLDTTNPKIQIVDHTEILPAESLPCFNSSLLEQFLYKIPGLSEYFIFSNDDMYINRPVTPGDFFDEHNLPYLFMNRKPFRKLEFWFREKVMKKPLSQYLQKINNASCLAEKHYGRYYGSKLHHNMDAYCKSIFVRTHQLFGEQINTMLLHHMRSDLDIHRTLYSYVAQAEKLGHLCYVSQKHSFRLHINNRSHYHKFERYNPVLFCMNDSEHANDDDRRFAIEYVSKLFPEKSQFEK